MPDVSYLKDWRDDDKHGLLEVIRSLISEESGSAAKREVAAALASALKTMENEHLQKERAAMESHAKKESELLSRIARLEGEVSALRALKPQAMPQPQRHAPAPSRQACHVVIERGADGLITGMDVTPK